MERELRKYKNLRSDINSLARDINLAISSLRETSDLCNNFTIDDVSKDKNTILNMIEDLDDFNKSLRTSVTNSINSEIKRIQRAIERQNDF